MQDRSKTCHFLSKNGRSHTIRKTARGQSDKSGNEPEDVMRGHDEHEEDESDEASRIDRLRNFRFDGAPDDAFNNDEKQPAAVKRRHGQEIDEREVYGNERH